MACGVFTPTLGCVVSEYLSDNSWFIETGMASVSTSDLDSGTGLSGRIGIAESWDSGHRQDLFLQYDHIDFDTANVSSVELGLIGYFGHGKVRWFIGGGWPYRWSSTGDSGLGLSLDLGGAFVAERFHVKLSGVLSTWPGDGITSAELRLGLSLVLF